MILSPSCRKVAQICQQHSFVKGVQRRQIASTSRSFAGVDVAKTSELITSSSNLPSYNAPGSSSSRQNNTPSSEMVGPVWAPKKTSPFPYRLHAQCTKHNTILNLTRSIPESSDPRLFQSEAEKPRPSQIVKSYQSRYRQSKELEDQVKGIEQKLVGSTVLRTSSGTVGFKKGQRSSFEAATRATNKMLELIGTLGTTDRKRKNGTKVRDPEPTSIDLVLKGFGPGREAVISAIQSGAGDAARKKISRIIEATPIKIGGTRPRKRRMLSPPLDLSRRR